jgi:hypothetical protein
MTLKTTRICMALFAASLYAANASAQENLGTAEQRAACMPDAFRLCLSAIPDASKVEQCLRQSKSDLGNACRSVFEASTAWVTGGGK